MSAFIDQLFHEVTDGAFDGSFVCGQQYVVISLYGIRNEFCSAEQANLQFPGAFCCRQEAQP